MSLRIAARFDRIAVEFPGSGGFCIAVIHCQVHRLSSAAFRALHLEQQFVKFLLDKGSNSSRPKTKPQTRYSEMRSQLDWSYTWNNTLERRQEEGDQGLASSVFL